MKSKIFVIVISIISIVTFLSCSKSKNEKLNPEQQVLLTKMDASYNTAKVYNDSLITCSTNNSILINYYDSCYHVNDSMFNHCHSSMMNTDGGMMSGNGGMMNSSGNNGMCNTQNNELNQVMTKMNQLREVHNNYHPF